MKLIVAYCVLLIAQADACTNLLITPGAHAEGTSTISYMADSGGMFAALGYYPPTNETMRQTYDWDSGTYLGQIPGAKHETYNVVGNTNEHGLTIGETTFGGNSTLAGGPGLLSYGSVIWVTLQRAKTAQEAITVMDELMQAYGYTSSGESFSIADPNEVWIMEVVGKGPKTKGSIWVAKKLPDGTVAAHANQARIRAPLVDDPSTCRYAKDVVSFAQSIGLYPVDSPVERFSFSDTFDPLGFLGARVAEARVWELFRQISNDPNFGGEYEDYILGKNLSHRMPLWITPKHKLTLNETFWLMRSQYKGTDLDMQDSTDVGSGPFNAAMRVRPLFWKFKGKQYHNERPIAIQITAWHFTAQMKKTASGSIVWFSVDDTSHSVHFPAFSKSTRISQAWADKGIQHVNDLEQSTTVSFDSAFWVFNMVANLVYSRYEHAQPIVAREIVRQEVGFIARVDAVEKEANALFASGLVAEAIERLTVFSVSAGDGLVSDWLQLWKDLFFRFRDQMTVEPPKPTGNPKDHPWPSTVEQGYPESWYGHIIASTGDRYAVPAAASAELEWDKSRVLGL